MNLSSSLSKTLALTAVNATGLKFLGADALGDLGVGLKDDCLSVDINSSALAMASRTWFKWQEWATQANWG